MSLRPNAEGLADLQIKRPAHISTRDSLAGIQITIMCKGLQTRKAQKNALIFDSVSCKLHLFTIEIELNKFYRLMNDWQTVEVDSNMT